MRDADSGADTSDEADTFDEDATAETEESSDPYEPLRDVLVLLVLTVTAVITAWCGFEASKWGGEMSIAFSEASSSRIQAARAQGTANNARQIDVSLWTLYVQATAESNQVLAKYVESRFTDRLDVAYQAWKADARRADSPFDLAAYKPPGTAEAETADRRADQKFALALDYNQRGDNYTLLTVLFALVLLFAAVSPRPSRPRAQWLLLALAMAAFLAGVIMMLQLPIIV